MSKDLTFRVHGLLMALGVILILIGIGFAMFWKNYNQIATMITTVGGTFFGCSLSWNVEEVFKKKDDRADAKDLFKKAIEIMDRGFRKESDLPSEEDIALFRRKLHLYYSTKSEEGDLYWNYCEYDFSFSEGATLGKLITEATYWNLKGNKKHSYKVEMLRRFANDNLIIINRQKGTHDPITISIFDACVSSNMGKVFGMSVHDDWSNNWRLSPSILSFNQIFPNQKEGACTRKQSLHLQQEWKNRYFANKGKFIFEEYV